MQKADAVVITYACDQRETLTRLSTFWLLELRRLEVRVCCTVSILVYLLLYQMIVDDYNIIVLNIEVS